MNSLKITLPKCEIVKGKPNNMDQVTDEILRNGYLES